MTRRGALGLVASYIGFLQLGQKTSDSGIAFIPNTPMNLTVSFDQIKDVIVRSGKRSVSITPTELMDALEGKNE